MVDKMAFDWIKTEVGKAIHPYDDDAPLTDEEALDELERFMDNFDFKDSEKVLLHGSPSPEENEVRYTLFEKTALYLQNTGHNEPVLYAHETFEDMVEDSDFLNTRDVNFIEADVTEDELTGIYNNHEIVSPKSGKRVHITSDYHAEGVDSLNNKFDLEDYLVLSADTSGEDFPNSNYREIITPPSNIINKIPGREIIQDKLDHSLINWKTYAEGKEAGRKLMDKYRGPRF